MTAQVDLQRSERHTAVHQLAGTMRPIVPATSLNTYCSAQALSFCLLHLLNTQTPDTNTNTPKHKHKHKHTHLLTHTRRLLVPDKNMNPADELIDKEVAFPGGPWLHAHMDILSKIAGAEALVAEDNWEFVAASDRVKQRTGARFVYAILTPVRSEGSSVVSRRVFIPIFELGQNGMANEFVVPNPVCLTIKS